MQLLGLLDQGRPIQRDSLPIGGGDNIAELLLTLFSFPLLLLLDRSKLGGLGGGATGRG
jgi:hypothetical protein